MRLSRRSKVDPFIVMDILEAANDKARQGQDIIHMEIGQPSTGAPKGAIQALSDNLFQYPMGYTEALGLPALRARIAKLYEHRHGLDISPNRIIVTAGSSAAFQLAFINLFDVGDKVAIGDPGYPSYRNILKALSIESVGIQTSIENRFQPTVKDLGSDLQGLLVASPANPSGTMLNLSSMKHLIDHCQQNDIAFISDEIYQGIEYENKSVSALEISNDVYVINSFSKYYSMTGWRVGWMVVPEDHVRSVERLVQNLFICAPHVSQVAALAALDCEEELENHIDVYQRNRALLLQTLPKIGFTKIAPPDGAFYIYADVSDLTSDSQSLCREILDDVGVALTPGTDFDPIRGHQTLRFSYAQSHEKIVEAVARLGDWNKKRLR